ncbi:putative F-box domain, leucine-rich repeat domain superfamily, F-box-like domain superfamily [Helianthus annuus]|nr:putative F-box domain, leucine-rich repeat domain superfamily, F-box-like domain superfamily [Helianthus annuus]KAJ0630980.1 putative F-box domain, leucine-rich repeat domain superfamily, F-box-like domain superfamily [Helianthus annuus]KAJ0634851.1 putative F-box domain, leucine-rich repeat domain superfamily, F-box-like domain superfamily [Helianthus annuus]
MGSRCERKRMNVEGDRLSTLPDDIIHKILSFVSTKHVVETSVLSSRWRYIWTSMPSLNFSTKDFHTLPKFSEFVKHVLSGRNNQMEVFSIELTFHGKVSVKRILNYIMNYTLSHNVQQLNVTCLLGKIEVPLSLFSSPSLKHLTLSGFTFGFTFEISVTTLSTWELPSLATLNLHFVTFYEENSQNTDKCVALFSNFANLKNLTLDNCIMIGALDRFNICHPGLCSLTLEHVCGGGNVVTPQLKNLTVNHWQGKHLISAPNLSSLHYKDCYYKSYNFYDDGYSSLKLSTDLLHLEKADICVKYSKEDKASAHEIVRLLQQMRSVKFLTLNLELVQLLGVYVELISHEPSPFANLTSLKIYPSFVNLEDQTQRKVFVSTEVKRFLLDSSQRATYTLVSHEIKATKNVASAQNLMRELEVLLDQWKEDSEANTAHMESHMETMHEQVEVDDRINIKTKWRFTERITHIESFWECLNKQVQWGNKKVLLLQKIEGVLTKLPTSHRDKLQPRFSGLCGEAETIMDGVMDRMKILFDKRPSHSNIYFHEPVASRSLALQIVSS